MKRLLKKVILLLYHGMVHLLPIRKKVIIFYSNLGRNYTGNPKSIYEYMVTKGLDHKFRCYYVLNQPDIKIPGKGKTVRNSRFFYYYLMAVAGVWVSDTRFPNYIVKRKGVTYIQTWHGTPLKKLALDMDSVSMAEESNIDNYKKDFKRNSATWDYLISQNTFSSNIFRRAFDFHGQMLEIGYPRNDILFHGNRREFHEKLKRKFRIPLDKKVILYAPTWRDNAYYNKASYKFESPMDYNMVKEALSDEYVMIVKYHYMVNENIDWSCYEGFYRKFDNSYDISELYLISDLLITDYSSVMFDYSLLGRPMIFYAFDLKEYKEELRGFYFDFESEAPGPIVENTESLIKEIKNYNYAYYKNKYEVFEKNYHLFEGGNASEKVVDLIVKTINE